ncbi:MAG: hypothetical protein QE263_06475 [Vampirovibrionales bacterium]|nr:hypothetical protein [Vampirovibrionales bacterium]
MHKLARQGFFRWLFPKQSKKIQNKIEQKIIYHPKSSWKDTMPDWLKPYRVTIKTDSGLELEAYYKPPKTPKDLVWRAVHGNAGGLIDMADLVEQGGLQNADSGFFIYALPGFNHSKGPLTEEAMVESFLAGTHFLKTQNVPKSQQAIIAVSLGGAIATLAIAQESEAIEDPIENPNNRLYAFLGIVHSLTSSDDAYDGFLDATQLPKKKFSPRGHLSQTFYADAAIAKLKVPIIGFFIGDKDTFLSPTMMKSQLHTFQKTRQPDQNIIVAHSNADHYAKQITTAYTHLIPYLEQLIKAFDKQHKSGVDPSSN